MTHGRVSDCPGHIGALEPATVQPPVNVFRGMAVRVSPHDRHVGNPGNACAPSYRALSRQLERLVARDSVCDKKTGKDGSRKLPNLHVVL